MTKWDHEPKDSMVANIHLILIVWNRNGGIQITVQLHLHSNVPLEMYGYRVHETKPISSVIIITYVHHKSFQFKIYVFSTGSTQYYDIDESETFTIYHIPFQILFANLFSIKFQVIIRYTTIQIKRKKKHKTEMNKEYILKFITSVWWTSFESVFQSKRLDFGYFSHDNNPNFMASYTGKSIMVQTTLNEQMWIIQWYRHCNGYQIPWN